MASQAKPPKVRESGGKRESWKPRHGWKPRNPEGKLAPSFVSEHDEHSGRDGPQAGQCPFAVGAGWVCIRLKLLARRGYGLQSRSRTSHIACPGRRQGVASLVPVLESKGSQKVLSVPHPFRRRRFAAAVLLQLGALKVVWFEERLLLFWSQQPRIPKF